MRNRRSLEVVDGAAGGGLAVTKYGFGGGHRKFTVKQRWVGAGISMGVRDGDGGCARWCAVEEGEWIWNKW